MSEPTKLVPGKTRVWVTGGVEEYGGSINVGDLLTYAGDKSWRHPSGTGWILAGSPIQYASLYANDLITEEAETPPVGGRFPPQRGDAWLARTGREYVITEFVQACESTAFGSKHHGSGCARSQDGDGHINHHPAYMFTDGTLTFVRYGSSAPAAPKPVEPPKPVVKVDPYLAHRRHMLAIGVENEQRSIAVLSLPPPKPARWVCAVSDEDLLPDAGTSYMAPQ